MSQAEKLLNSLSASEEVTPLLVDTETEPHIVVGEDRYITVPDELKRIAVQYDHNVETVIFDCPRYWDEHDMSLMKIYINYMLPNGEIGCYNATNVTVDEENPNIMHFEWTITNRVTTYKGYLSFLVCIRSVDSENKETNHWNSELNEDMYISEGLDNDEEIVAMYPDVITQLLLQMDLIIADMDRMGTCLVVEDDGNGNVTIKNVNHLGVVCEVYNNGYTYEVGDYCRYLGVLYRCTTAIDICEEFDPNKWEATCVTDELQTCYQFVNNEGAAITGTLDEMNTTLDEIKAAIDNLGNTVKPEGNATASNVLLGKTFMNDTGKLITGTMPNNSSAENVVLAAGETYTVPLGFHDGFTTVGAKSLAEQTVADASGADILIGKTAYVNGIKVIGSMASIQASTVTITPEETEQSYTIPQGYHTGEGKVVVGAASIVEELPVEFLHVFNTPTYFYTTMPEVTIPATQYTATENRKVYICARAEGSNMFKSVTIKKNNVALTVDITTDDTETSTMKTVELELITGDVIGCDFYYKNENTINFNVSSMLVITSCATGK